MKPDAWLVGSTCLFAGLLVGTLSAKSAQAPKPAPGHVVARQINLVDRQGAPRITLNGDFGSDHESTVVLHGWDGRSSITLEDSSAQIPEIVMVDEAGTKSIVILGGVHRQELYFADKQGYPTVRLFADKDGGHVQTLSQSEPLLPTGQLP